MKKLAVIHALWIGESKPDFVSLLIQRVLNKNYSHNAFIYEKTGKLWEATFGEKNLTGVVERDLDSSLEGCIIRASRRIVLHISEEQFELFLEQERGKSYAHEQNLATIFKWFTPWAKNRNKKRHCSELLAAAASFGPYIFPKNKDFITPVDTFRIIKPDIYTENSKFFI